MELIDWVLSIPPCHTMFLDRTSTVAEILVVLLSDIVAGIRSSTCGWVFIWNYSVASIDFDSNARLHVKIKIKVCYYPLTAKLSLMLMYMMKIIKAVIMDPMRMS